MRKVTSVLDGLFFPRRLRQGLSWSSLNQEQFVYWSANQVI